MPKVAVIIGAGAGVGRATAEEFARHGFDVALLSRDAARLEQAAGELRRKGVRALPIPTDVADAAAVEAAADRAEAELGPIDVWVNVAMDGVLTRLPADRRRGRARHPDHLSRTGARHDVGAEADAGAQSRHHRQCRELPVDDLESPLARGPRE